MFRKSNIILIGMPGCGKTTIGVLLAKAMAKESKARIIDSTRNCDTSCLRTAPTTFLIPISLARLEARAVDKLIKLTQAITTMKMMLLDAMLLILKVLLSLGRK